MTTINNKFPNSGLIRRSTMFGQMFLMIVAMLSFDPGGLSTSYGLFAIGLIFLSCGIAYLDVGIRIKEVRRSMFLSATAAVIAFVICLVGIPIAGNEYLSASRAIPFAALGAVVLAIPLAYFYSHRAQRSYRIQLHHLDERWGQLTLITLGKSFLLFSEELAGEHEVHNFWIFILAFITIVALWRLYFDSAMRRPYKTEPATRHYYALIIAQFFLLVAIVAMLDSLIDAVAGISGDDTRIFALLIAGSLLFLLALALLTWGRRSRTEGVVVTHIVMAIVIGHWVQFYLFWDENLSEELFVVGICVLLVAYSWSINLIDKHANRLIQTRLPADSLLGRKVKTDSDEDASSASESSTISPEHS